MGIDLDRLVDLVRTAARRTWSDDSVPAAPQGESRHRRLVGQVRKGRIVDVVTCDQLIKLADIGVGLEIAREWRAKRDDRADLLRAAMRQLPCKHAAKAPADEQELAPVLQLIDAPFQQFHRVPFRAGVQAEEPRVGTPARAGERPPQLHRRPIGRQEAGNHQDRWAVLGTARAERTKARKHSRNMPRDLTQALPCRRCKIVRMNLSLARRRAQRRWGTSPFHAPKMKSLRYRNNKLLEST